MLLASEQSKLNLKNLVRSLNLQEIQSMAAGFARNSGAELERSVKSISPGW